MSVTTLNALMAASQWLDVLVERFDIVSSETMFTVNVVGPEGRREVARRSLAESLAQIDDAIAEAQEPVGASVAPHFMLVAGDPLAPFLTSIWSSLRFGDAEAAAVKFEAMMKVAAVYDQAPDIDRAIEALELAMAMFRWQAAHG